MNSTAVNVFMKISEHICSEKVLHDPPVLSEVLYELSTRCESVPLRNIYAY